MLWFIVTILNAINTELTGRKFNFSGRWDHDVRPQEILERMRGILRCVDGGHDALGNIDEGIYKEALKENNPEKLQRWLYLLSLGYQVLQLLPESCDVSDLLTAYKITIDKILAVTISESAQLAEPSSSWFNFLYTKTVRTIQEYVVEGFIDYLIGNEETEQEKESDRHAFKIAIILYPQCPAILENAFLPGVFIKEEDVEARWCLLDWLQSELQTEKEVFIGEIKIFDRTNQVVELLEKIELKFSKIDEFLIKKRNSIAEEKSKLFLSRLNEEVLTTGSVFFSSKKNNPKADADDLTNSASVIDLSPPSVHPETEGWFCVLLWIAQKSRMFLNLVAQYFCSRSDPRNNRQDANNSEEASLLTTNQSTESLGFAN